MRSPFPIVGALAVALLSVGAASAAGPKAPPFAFGGVSRVGAYAVTVTADGSVHATGAEGLTRVGAPRLTPAQLAALNRSVGLAHFGALPALTRCPGRSSGSTSWIRVGSKKVTVDGACVPVFHQLFRTFVTATRFYVSW